MLNASIPERLQQMVEKKRGRVIAPELPNTKIDNMAQRGQQFIERLSPNSKSLILEFKPASPSKGVINDQVSVTQMVPLYQAFASCISVLVDDVYFGGSYDNLAKARQLTELPLLAKDITFEPAQITMAKSHGADVILLMLSVLSDSLYCELYQLAQTLGLAVITEVADAEECRRLQHLPAGCVGINHRNFSDLSIDLTKTQQLMALIPEGIPVIAESGINEFDDFLQVHPGVCGYLIGSSLMASDDPALKLRQLLFTDLKVCGITQSEQAKALQQAGANRIGVIRTPLSPRYIADQQELAAISQSCQRLWGVYLDQPAQLIADECRRFKFDTVQLHGAESESFIQALRQLLPPATKICKVLNGALATEQQITALLAMGVEVMLDQQSAADKGGTGESFDWQRIPTQLRAQVNLAGGIDANNIKAALALGYRKFDVNSKIELSPGNKDSALFNELMGEIEIYRGNSHVYG